MILSRLVFPLAVLVALSGAADLGAAPASTKTKKDAKTDPKAGQLLDAELWKAYRWREVGPYRGGRSAAVAGIPGERDTYYFGNTGGGVWKTTDGGRAWKNVSDGFFGGSIGAVAVAPGDPNVIYAGGGEKTVRGNVSEGGGVWKSTDAGRTWQHAGLDDSRIIPRIRIHPKDPDLVYAAVLGHLFGPNDMRGVYRSKNGGKTWDRIHFVNRDAGAIDLAMDPTNPRILYASFWRVRRTPYSLESGGAGSSLWKSTDGGDTWTELTHHPGLPKGTVGIIGIAVSPSNPDNLYAIIEAEEGGVFRSKDAGATWTRTNEDRSLRQRAWYYTRIYADPKDEEAVYVVNVQFHRSKDGGRTFTNIRTPHGDNHDLWIDPGDPLRMIEANDGGVNVSVDGGRTWTPQNNQPTSQIYRVSTDNNFPYRILGAQQDNSALRILSRSAGPGISFNDWQETAGGESGHIVADPDDPEIVYGGSYGGFLTRVDHRTGELRDINPWPDDPMGWGAADLEVRFQWNFPLLFSPHDGNTLYAAGNRLFRSANEGQTWEPISPDLTRNDKSKQGPSGGPITKDNTSVEYYCTIFAVAESPLEKGVIWTGSDDGLIHVTRDGGRSWKNVTPPDLPEWAQINSIEAHPFEKGGLYVAATRYKLDDRHPYLYRTTDWGATWTRLANDTNGIDPAHFTRVIRADPERRGLLFAGTENGIYVSWNDGGRWEPLQLNLPIVPVTDLTIKQGDLIAATQGRGFWVLDGLTLLRQLPADFGKELRLFAPVPAWLLQSDADFGDGPPRGQGENPPNGAAIYYWLPEVRPGQTARIEFLGKDGAVLRTFEGKAEEEPAKPEESAAKENEKDEDKEEAEKPQDPAQKPELGNPEKDPAKREKEKAEERRKKEDEEEQKPTVQKGLNRFVWDLHEKRASSFPGLILWSGDPAQPRVPPGDYQVRLTLGNPEETAAEKAAAEKAAAEKTGVVKTASVRVLVDPRSKSTAADLEAQHRFLVGIRDKLTETHDAIRRIREVRAQLDGLRERLSDVQTQEGQQGSEEVLDAARELDRKMTSVEEALYQTKNKSRQDPLNFPIRLNDKLNALAASAGSGAYRPTDQHVAARDRLTAAIDAELARLREIWDKDLPAFNELARTKGVAAVIVPAPRLK